MMPDMAAMMTAISEVTMAMPPRTPLSQKSNESYISLATPDRSRSAAMKMKSGTDMSTYSVKRSKIFWVRI